MTRCVAEDGIYRVEFANKSTWAEGLIDFNWGAAEQKTIGKFNYTDGSYSGEAEVIGHFTLTDDVIEFNGTWHDEHDESGIWDVYVSVEGPPNQTYTFTYDDPA